jgi:hypothetical protein
MAKKPKLNIMNINTNELRDMEGKSIEDRLSMQNNGFISVPLDLSRSARRHLGKEESVIIPLKSKSKLAIWAEKVRKNQNKSGHN